MIRGGRVAVNGAIVREMGVQVEPDSDVVMVDGKAICDEEERIAIAFHKPAGVISSCHTSREMGPAITDFVDLPYRLYPAGRLDKDSTGLVILTNDGGLALQIMHPRYGKEKEYLVTLERTLSKRTLKALQRGIELDDRLVRPLKVTVLPDGSVDVVVTEGRKRLVRRMFEAVGNLVVTLHRVRIGPIQLGQLEIGAWRRLSPEEIHALRNVINP
jgi:pseudouridine synthase